ncbi:MAG TPA: hypothetical protein VM888_04890 [Chitinophagaceae bacterium]|jgi:hypothetical protein|nr:hypothetical protein [Chitinophagaceae bacterium]
MKKVSIIYWKKIISNRVLVVAAVGLLTVNSLNAQAVDSTKTIPVEIKYVGNQYNRPVFQISLDNKVDEKVYVTLTDAEGNILYTDIMKGKKYEKKIQFEGPDWDDLQVTLVLNSKNQRQVQTFQINKSRKTVEDVLVAKL